MNILFLTRLYYPHIGGVEKQVKKLSSKLTKRGFDIKIITEKFDRSLPENESINGVEVIRINYPKIRYIGLIYIWVWLIINNKYFRWAEIVHTHGVFVWYWPFRFIFPKKPIYTTFHGWEGVYPIPRKNILLRKIAAALSWKNIVIGKFVEKHYGIKADKVLHTSVDAPRNQHFKKDNKMVLYVGRLDEDTGLRKILKALSYIKDYKVVFCGDGPLSNECKKYGKVLGFVNPDPYYRRAFICLSPGVTSILEAFTYKCLIITTYDSPVKKDYLRMTPFYKWIVVENSPKKLARRIIYYSKNINKTNSKIEKAYKWVSNQNWDNATQAYLDLWGIK